MTKDNNGITRLTEIIQLATKLKWISAIPKEYNLKFSYPLMQLSEVEKCMIAMFDNNQLQRMRDWVKQDELRTKIAIRQEHLASQFEKARKHWESVPEWRKALIRGKPNDR